MEQTKQSLDTAEIESIKKALKRSYKERFLMATRLYKIQETMKLATVTHNKFISK